MKRNVTVVLFLLLINNLTAQKDTIFYDANWRLTVKDSASFFRPGIKKIAEGYRVRDYYITGELQMEGISKSDQRDIWDGQVTWYSKNGTVYQQGTYANGRLWGEFITYIKDRKLVAQYHDGKFVEGEQNVTYNNGAMYYTTQRNDTIIQIIHDDDLSGIRFERYSTSNDKNFLVKYYDDRGTLIGERTTMGNGNFKGIEVIYYYTPMRKRYINHYGRGRILATSYYYPNGKPRELFLDGPEPRKVFYDEEGTVLAEIDYLQDQYSFRPWDGTLIQFKTVENDLSDIKTGMARYENGKKTLDILYHDNGQIKTKTTFEEGRKKLQIGYDQQGVEATRMEYQNYLPWNGTEVIGDKKGSYKDGKLVEETNFYPRSNTPFSKKTLFKETYFDRDGGILGALELNGDTIYPKPVNGKRFFYDYPYGEINSIEKYSNGYVVERTNFRNRVIDAKNKQLRFKRIEYYQPGTYNKIKELTHYSNGALQAEITFNDYKKEQGSYFDRDGKSLGAFDFVEQEGVRYEFFNDSDEVKEIEEVRDGKRIRFQEFTYGPDRIYGNIDPILVTDINVDCCASFYDRQGELIAQCTYKDQKPWEGVIYNSNTYEKISYRKGQRNGTYQKMTYAMRVLEEGNYSEDRREGSFKTYNDRGVLQSEENYTNGQLNGKASYYDQKGTLIGTMEYRDGTPYDGIRTTDKTYPKARVTETYTNGILVMEEAAMDTGNRITRFLEDGSADTTVFMPGSDQKRLSFSSKSGLLDGAVSYYDETGNPSMTAMVKQGRLINGTLLLKPSGSDGNMQYSKVTKGEETVSLVIYGQDDKILFQAEEHLYFGAHTYYLQNLNIRLDYLTDKKLY